MYSIIIYFYYINHYGIFVVCSATWVDPIHVKLDNNFDVYSAPPPGSGVLVAYIMNILDGHLAPTVSTDPLNYHRMAEAFKHAYAQRTKLADPTYEPEVNDVIQSKFMIIYYLKKQMNETFFPPVLFYCFFSVDKEFDFGGVGFGYSVEDQRLLHIQRSGILRCRHLQSGR